MKEIDKEDIPEYAYFVGNKQEVLDFFKIQKVSDMENKEHDISELTLIQMNNEILIEFLPEDNHGILLYSQLQDLCEYEENEEELEEEPENDNE